MGMGMVPAGSAPGPPAAAAGVVESLEVPAFALDFHAPDSCSFLVKLSGRLPTSVLCRFTNSRAGAKSLGSLYGMQHYDIDTKWLLGVSKPTR